MYVTISKPNYNIRREDLIKLFTFDFPIFKMKEDGENIMIMYNTLSQIQLCLEFDGVEFVDPLQINYVELLTPTNIKDRREKIGRCICFISDFYMEIEKLESLTAPIMFFIYKAIQGKHFFIVEYETSYEFSNCTGFYDIFTFEDYLDSLVYCGKI
ncbi:hypothetical protein NGRA_0104 [Nosema granulosis]|uniref:Uncharacterized protein n=1 Tax=Nosema granulosis TaxID=83296 RepID=A0A9P6H0X1_9MICR|nr:hypothetical protein NGRA_0104 [Nosema granulosis]